MTKRAHGLLRLVAGLLLLGGAPPSEALHSCPGKLSGELENQIDDPEYANVTIDVVIEMYVALSDPAYADVTAIADAAPTHVEKVRQVYNAIRAEAETIQTRSLGAQGSIRTALAAGVASGNVDAGWQAHWLGNELAAMVKPALLRTLCARSDVARISLARGGQKLMNTLPDQTNPGWSLARIGAPAAWAAGFKGRGAKVGIIDTGINAKHKDLKSVCEGGTEHGKSCVGTCEGCNCPRTACTNGGGVCLGPLVNAATGQPYWKDVTGTAPDGPTDDVGHGTFVAGVAVGRNGIGVAPEANWMVCKGLVNSGGFPTYHTENWLTDCAEFLINPDGVPEMNVANAVNAADVIVLPYPLGQPLDNAAACDPLASSGQSFQQKVARMRAMDILPVFPVGENLQTGSGALGVPVPANYRPALAVGMSSDSETFTPGAGTDPMDPASNRGSILCLDDQVSTSTRPGPGLLAPGRGVLGPWMPTCPNCFDAYQKLSGSDVAAAHVAGAAALLRAINPDLLAQPSPFGADKRWFNLDEVLKRRSYNYVEAPFRAGRVDLAAAIADWGAPDQPVIPASFPNPFYTSEPGIPNTQSVQVSMRNWSPFTWTTAAPPANTPSRRGPMKLVDATFPANPWRVGPSGNGKVDMPLAAVHPGNPVVFSFPATAPDTLAGGSYQYRDVAFSWRMLRASPDAVFGIPTPASTRRIHGRDRSLGGGVSPPFAQLPAYPCSSSQSPLYVQMTNSGTTTWTAPGTPGADGYSARWYLYHPNGVTLLQWGDVNVSGVVGPGGSFWFPITNVCAPVADGTYVFRLEVRRNGTPLAFGTMLNGSIPVTNVATNTGFVWEWAPGFGPPIIHWRVVMRNDGTRIWDGNYCLREIRGRSWAHPGLPAIPQCLVGGFDVTPPGGTRIFDGYLNANNAPYGLWWYALQLYRPDGPAFGPQVGSLVEHQWNFGATWSSTQGYAHWFFLDNNPDPPVWLSWHAAQGRWERWDGNTWENPWIDSQALRPALSRPAVRTWQSPTAGWARMRVVFRNPNESSPSCPNEESVGIWVCHFNSAWYPLNCWVPNTGEGTRLRNGQSLVIDTGDPISTVDGDPNGFFVNPGDFIATSAGSWNNAECDKTFDNESTNPLQVWIWQKTPETPTYQ